ncbi:hypothetical protein D3C80_510380 [compost metagenome]
MIVDALVSQNNDWVIVAINADELRSKDRGTFFIRKKMAETIGQFDLFGMSSPIKHDKYFYGREAIVQELVQRAVARKEQSGLFGLRKTGKTSVLFAIQRRLREKNVLAEYVDCQSPGIYGARWWAVLAEITLRLRDAVGLRASQEEVSEAFTPDHAANDFVRAIKAIQQSSKTDQIVLLLDEIEFITPGISNHLGQHWDDDHLPFWQTIRSASQETGGFITFCVAGVNPSSVEQSHFNQIQNPIFQLAVPFYLEPLTRQSVREMVRSIGKYSGIVFDEDCFDFLRSAYGGHPYLIRLACSEVSRGATAVSIDRKIRVGVTDFTTRASQISVRLMQPIKDILLSLVWWYPDEYDLLCILADGQSTFVNDFLAQEPEKAIHFARYGLVHEGSASVAIQDLRTFLSRFGTEYRNEISPFRRGDLPPELLPELPNLADLSLLFERRTEVEYSLRRMLLTILNYRFAFDEKAVSKAIAAALPKRNGADPAQLFIGRSPQSAVNELYLSDLKHAFVKNWDCFSPYFGTKPDRFEMNLDTINIARRFEAHTKPLPWADRENFLNSFSWLQDKMRRVPGVVVDTSSKDHSSG